MHGGEAEVPCSAPGQRADGIGEQNDVHNSPGAQGGDNSNPRPNPLRSECSNL
jgi:hypothetical protein